MSEESLETREVITEILLQSYGWIEEINYSTRINQETLNNSSFLITPSNGEYYFFFFNPQLDKAIKGKVNSFGQFLSPVQVDSFYQDFLTERSFFYTKGNSVFFSSMYCNLGTWALEMKEWLNRVKKYEYKRIRNIFSVDFQQVDSTFERLKNEGKVEIFE